MKAFAAENALARWLNVGLSFFYPETCQICKGSRASAAEGFVCAGCRQKVQFIIPPFCARCGLPFEGEITTSFECANCRGMELHFRSARSAVAAGDVVRETIHGYKYQHALWFEPFLAGLLLHVAVPELAKGNWELTLPVPLHPARKREREFNQAERLAEHLSEATRIPMKTNLLRRVDPTRTQTQLSRQERMANVRNAFAMWRQQKLHGERIVLVDDVFTTGATTNACARVLRAAGAGEVCVWTVARGL